MVCRRKLDIRYCTLGIHEFTMINAIKNQATFAEICEFLSHTIPEDEVANYLVKELYAWFQEEVFALN
jgi:hypothetical protein